MSKVYIFIHDKTKKMWNTVYEKNKQEFQKLNQEWYWVYFAVNEFEATEDQMLQLAKENAERSKKVWNWKPTTKRNIPFLQKINAVFADLDIAKSWDWVSREEKEIRKQKAIEAIMNKLPPSVIIDTSNWIQPLWYLNETSIDVETQKKYVNCINWIIEWSKQYWCTADAVKDVTRVLRLPWYYHQKEEKYLCETKYIKNIRYDLEDVIKVFPYQEKVVLKEQKDFSFNPTDPVALAVDNLDIREVFEKAMSSIGRSVEYDKTDRIIIDWRLTWNFVSDKIEWTIASTSHENYWWNKVTCVANVLNCSTKDAYKWIIETFNLDREKIKARQFIEKIKSKPIEPKLNKRFSWWTNELNRSFAVIKPTDFIVMTWERGDWKTTFAFYMARENAKMWHKVLFLSLEMDTEQIYEDIARRYSWITINEEFENKIPEIKQKAFEKKLREIKTISNMFLQWVRRWSGINWIAIKEIIWQNIYDMVYIDNLDLIQWKDKQENNDKQKEIVTQIMWYTSENQVPIVLLHHYRKKSWQTKWNRWMDDVSWTWKIADWCDRFVHVIRKNKMSSIADETKETTLFLEKARWYNPCIRKVYFEKWEFTDNVPWMIKAIESLRNL